jgi:hypothetical protein
VSSKEYRKKKPTKQLLWSARHRAKRRGTPFDIDESDIVIPDVCPLLGIPLFIMDGKPGNNSPTLDEVRCGEGYTKGNVRVISHKANTMKQDHTVETMERFILYMKGMI